MNGQRAKAAVAEHTALGADEFTARRAPGHALAIEKGHAGAWYVCEKDVMKMPIDDQVWVVLPSGEVCRAIPFGNPIHEPTNLR